MLINALFVLNCYYVMCIFSTFTNWNMEFLIISNLYAPCFHASPITYISRKPLDIQPVSRLLSRSGSLPRDVTWAGHRITYITDTYPYLCAPGSLVLLTVNGENTPRLVRLMWDWTAIDIKLYFMGFWVWNKIAFYRPMLWHFYDSTDRNGTLRCLQMIGELAYFTTYEEISFQRYSFLGKTKGKHSEFASDVISPISFPISWNICSTTKQTPVSIMGQIYLCR